MTKRDFVKISSAIRSCTVARGSDDRGAGEAYARAIAHALSGGSFDRDRFLLACGVPVEPEPNR